MRTRTFTVIILLAAVVRFALLGAAWNHPQQVRTPDTQDYITLSDSLAGGSFERDGQSEIFRTPGYPFFLLLGAVFSGDNWWRFILILQVLIDVGLVYLTFLLATMACGDQRAGLLAAAFQALSAVAVAASTRVLSDSLFAAMLTLAVLLALLHLKTLRLWPLLAAVLLSAACYVRPVGQIYIAVFAAALLLHALRTWRAQRSVALPAEARTDAQVPPSSAAKRSLGVSGPGRPIAASALSLHPRPRLFVVSAIVFVCMSAGLLAPWVVRNAVLADYVGFSSFASDSVHFWAMPELLARQQNIPPAAARDRVRELDRQQAMRSPEGRTPGQAVRDRNAYTREIIGSEPWTYARLHLRGAGLFFLPGATDMLEVAGLSEGNRGTSDVLRTEGVLAAAQHYFGDNAAAIALTVPMVLILALEYLGCLLWVVRRLRLSMPTEMWLLLALVVVTSLLSGPYGMPRYRTPIEPMLSVLAAAGWMAAKGSSKFAVRSSTRTANTRVR